MLPEEILYAGLSNTRADITMVAEISSAGTYLFSTEVVTGASDWTVQPHQDDREEYEVSDEDLKNSDGSSKSVRRLPRFQFSPGEDATPGEVMLKVAEKDSTYSRSILIQVQKG